MIESFWSPNIMELFPQRYNMQFYYSLGSVGTLVTIGLIVYMNKTWGNFKSKGQRLRFLTLLYMIVLLTAAAAEQVQQNASVELRNIGQAGGVVFMIYTLWVSVSEDLLHRGKKD